MNAAHIDKYILSELGSNWRKVAMVIARVMTNSPEAKAEFVATRVEALINDGRVEVQSSVKNWRYCEIRCSLPKRDT
ncbi:MAG: DUF3658 domain-containing protein [Pseudomonadota bacterium]